MEEHSLARAKATGGVGSDSADGATSSPEGRIALFDNLKGLLIILVVLGHIAHPVHNTNPVLSFAFDVVYLFHMPLFVLMSGLFAKSAYRNGKLKINRIISFIALGFAYQLALALINGAKLTPLRICAFTSAPWYLISMGCWYAMTPVLARLGTVRGMVASIAISLLSGLVDTSSGFLAIGRTCAFLPCFALGYYLRPATVASLHGRNIPWPALCLAGIVVAMRLIDTDSYSWFFPMVYGDNPYANGLFEGIAQRLTAFLMGALMSLAVLKLAPTATGWLTTLGRCTLQVYVLHRLARAWLTFHTPLYGFAWMNDPLAGTAMAMALTAATVALCAAPQLERPFARLLSIRWIRGE